MHGTIQSMRTEHGYGFLRDPEGAEVFFHHSVVIPPDRFVSLAVGMVVEFKAESSTMGPRATKITIVPETRR